MNRTMPYLNRYRPQNQKMVEGIPFNPILPPGFYSTPLNERDPLEIEDWSNRPFICTTSWSDKEEEYREERAKGFPAAYYEGHWDPDWWAAEGSDASFEETLVELRARWFDTFPDGNKYEVWVMDNYELWVKGEDMSDRHPIGQRGYCANLENAIKLANVKPNSNGLYGVEILRLCVQHWELPTPFEEL